MENLRLRIFMAAALLAGLLPAGVAWGKARVDSDIRFNDFYGEVKIRPNDDEDDAYEFAELDTVIYEDDRIKTEEDSGAILGLRDMSTYVLKECTTLIIHTEDGNTPKFEMLAGCLWGNVKKMMEGKTLDFDMAQCVAGIKGTIFALEEQGPNSCVWLFAGKVEVKSKKTGKKMTLEPGKMVSVGKDGKFYVEEFDIAEMAYKFGIPLEDILNHYSNYSNKKQPDETQGNVWVDIGKKMSYYFSGGQVTNKIPQNVTDAAFGGRYIPSPFEEEQYDDSYSCSIPEGKTLKLHCSCPGKKMKVVLRGDGDILKKDEWNGTIDLEYTVPKNQRNVTAEVTVDGRRVLYLYCIVSRSLDMGSGSGRKSSSSSSGNGSGSSSGGSASSPAVSVQTSDFNLLYRWGASNPVVVSWDNSSRELSVTYTNRGNYFEMTDMGEAQMSKLLKRTSSGLQEVSGVTTKVVARKDARSSNNKDYGTLVLKFYKNGSPYQFESGDYAVSFDIVARGYHHGNKTPWEFTVGGGSSGYSSTSGGSSSSGNSSSSPAVSVQKSDFNLRYRWGASNPVVVSWDNSSRELSVTYTNRGNYFEMTDMGEAQMSKLLKRTSSGLQEVSGVTTKVVARKDARSSNNKDYGTLVLKFYKNGSPYQFESGNYAVSFDIVACGYHHGNKTPWEFTVR